MVPELSIDSSSSYALASYGNLRQEVFALVPPMLLVTLLFVCWAQVGDYRYTDVGHHREDSRYFFNGSSMISGAFDKFGRRVPATLPTLTYTHYLEEFKASRGNIRPTYPLLIRDSYYDKDVYEFNSYRLIRGHIESLQVGKGIFIPEIGAVIKSMDDYLNSPELGNMNWGGDEDDLPVKRPKITSTTIPVYNLYGRIRGKNAPKKFTTLKDFPPSNLSVYPPVSTEKVVFHLNADYRCSLRFDKYIYTGKIDVKTGEFIYDDLRKRIEADSTPRPELPPWLMQPRKLSEQVYEFRSGRLIPGYLNQHATEEWLFIPDIGGVVIDAAKYLATYQPSSRRIYNLPGKFVP